MSDFLNKTWTLDEDCLDKEVLNECYQQQHLFDQSATTSKCSNEIDNIFTKLFQNNASFLLIDEDLTGFELENGDPICNEIPLSNNRKQSSSLSNVNNQTINIDYDYEETTTDLIEINSNNNNNNNLNVTINIQQQQQQPTKNKLNITVNIDDLDNHLPLTTEATTTTTTKENLNVTIEIKEKKLKSIENEQIPKTLDLFTQDLNKQSSHSPSNALSSSSSSSCSSLSSSSSSCSFSKHNNNNNNNKNYTGRLPVSSKLANYKSTNLRILTSSVDKDLNKITTIAELPKPTVKTVPRAVTHGLPQSVRTSIPSGIKTATTTTTNNNKRKSMIKKSGLPVSPTSNINNLTIDIGDENKLVTGSKKTTTVDLFNDIEASNIIQPIQLHNAFAHTSIPKSFDMFANDINKQTSIQLPSSTSGPSSSSCSSLASSSSSSSSLSLSLGSSNRYSLNRPSGILPVGNNKLLEYKSKFKILTSSIDKDLNKITNNNNNKQEEIIKTKPSVKSTIPIARPNSSGIPVPKSFIPKPASISGVLRNSTNNNIAIIKK